MFGNCIQGAGAAARPFQLLISSASTSGREILAQERLNSFSKLRLATHYRTTHALSIPGDGCIRHLEARRLRRPARRCEPGGGQQDSEVCCVDLRRLALRRINGETPDRKRAGAESPRVGGLDRRLFVFTHFRNILWLVAISFRLFCVRVASRRPVRLRVGPFLPEHRHG